MILMDYIWRRKVATIVIYGLCGSKAGGNIVPKGYTSVKVQEAYMSNSIMPFREKTVDLAHEETKMVEGATMFWTNKFLKLVGVRGN